MAGRVYLSQSALSHQIQVLEQYYKSELFERKSQPLRWFPAGQRLVMLMREVDVIVSRAQARHGLAFHPLFRYEIPLPLAKGLPLTAKPFLTAEDFVEETLITYPVPDDRLNFARKVLKPAGVNPVRRTTALTVAIVQLVASRRGVTALPR